MNENINLKIIPADRLGEQERVAVIDLCSQAYEEDYAPYLDTFEGAVHILASFEGQVVSHALWITRWLQIGAEPLLRTAYVEAVATTEKFRKQGLASAVMKRLAAEIADFEMGALCPAETSLYARLGWVFWQGPLFHRRAEKLIPDPEERVMILRLPQTPAVDLSQPISVEWREGEIW
jgi:aminoglycoside 2'-N-acetyltransferase I